MLLADRNMAYLAGLIAADGHVLKSFPKNIQLEMKASTTLPVLRFYADLLERNLSIREDRDAARVIFHGLPTQWKTQPQQFSFLSDLAPHYWRGLFDGDGGPQLMKDRRRSRSYFRMNFNAATHEPFGDACATWLQTLGVDYSVYRRDHVDTYCVSRQAEELAFLIYGCGGPAIPWKRELALGGGRDRLL